MQKPDSFYPAFLFRLSIGLMICTPCGKQKVFSPKQITDKFCSSIEICELQLTEIETGGILFIRFT
ncbi:hypothetical protein D3C87_228300 [compost metagenome]